MGREQLHSKHSLEKTGQTATGLAGSGAGVAGKEYSTVGAAEHNSIVTCALPLRRALPNKMLRQTTLIEMLLPPDVYRDLFAPPLT